MSDPIKLYAEINIMTSPSEYAYELTPEEAELLGKIRRASTDRAWDIPFPRVVVDAGGYKRKFNDLTAKMYNQEDS